MLIKSQEKKSSVMKDYIYKKVKELIDDGLMQMRDYNLSETKYLYWLRYSQEVIRILTSDYNPSIYLNYLRVGMNIDTTLRPTQKIGMCIDYLIGVLRIIAVS